MNPFKEYEKSTLSEDEKRNWSNSLIQWNRTIDILKKENRFKVSISEDNGFTTFKNDLGMFMVSKVEFRYKNNKNEIMRIPIPVIQDIFLMSEGKFSNIKLFQYSKDLDKCLAVKNVFLDKWEDPAIHLYLNHSILLKEDERIMDIGLYFEKQDTDYRKSLLPYLFVGNIGQDEFSENKNQFRIFGSLCLLVDGMYKLLPKSKN